MRQLLFIDVPQLENKSELIVRAEALLFINAATFYLTYAYNKEQPFSAHTFIGNISVYEILPILGHPLLTLFTYWGKETFMNSIYSFLYFIRLNQTGNADFRGADYFDIDAGIR